MLGFLLKVSGGGEGKWGGCEWNSVGCMLQR